MLVDDGARARAHMICMYDPVEKRLLYMILSYMLESKGYGNPRDRRYVQNGGTSA